MDIETSKGITLLPTRRRLAKLRNFLDSAKRAQTSTPGMVIVDEKEFEEFKEEYEKIARDLFPPQWRLRITKAEGMGPKIREVFDEIKDLDWVNILNDDHYIVTKEWDKRLIKQLTGKNMVTCNDRWNAPARAAGATMLSMGLIKAWEFPIFPPEIDHLGIDDVFENLCRNAGCWKIDMSTIIEHHHAYKNQDMMDETHEKVYGPKGTQWPGSPAAIDTEARLKKFIAETYPGALERTRALNGSVSQKVG